MKVDMRGVYLLLIVGLPMFAFVHYFLDERKRPEVVYVGESSAQESPRLGDPGWSGWIAVPGDFRRVQTIGRKSYGRVRSMDILDGRYNITVGSSEFTDPADGVLDFFSIDVTRPIADGFRSVGGLRFPLEYVSEDRLRAPAEDVVSVDPATHVVTYDLGKSVFKFQLPRE